MHRVIDFRLQVIAGGEHRSEGISKLMCQSASEGMECGIAFTFGQSGLSGQLFLMVWMVERSRIQVGSVLIACLRHNFL